MESLQEPFRNTCQAACLRKSLARSVFVAGRYIGLAKPHCPGLHGLVVCQPRRCGARSLGRPRQAEQPAGVRQDGGRWRIVNDVCQLAGSSAAAVAIDVEAAGRNDLNLIRGCWLRTAKPGAYQHRPSSAWTTRLGGKYQMPARCVFIKTVSEVLTSGSVSIGVRLGRPGADSPDKQGGS